MDYEWDGRKNIANVAKHGIDFRDAAEIFSGRVLRTIDRRLEYGEERVVAVGITEGRCLTVVYTMRSGVCRIISARRANKYERRAYSKILPV